ncbi:MAG TPA: Ig-like domain-containing protein [Oscillospiraceae bacterium]|nr:Ig-like domain-containing protein [Oscillospiraceae bacterium]
MKKRSGFISVLLALGIILSPVILTVDNIVNAEEMNINVSNEIEQYTELESRETELETTEELPELKEEFYQLKTNTEIKTVGKNSGDISIEDTIRSLRNYYSKKNEFSFREALGYYYTSNNLEEDLIEIGSKIRLNEDPSGAPDHVGNIISLIVAGANPCNYNGKGYVNELAAAFNPDDWPTSLAFRILALDMAGAEYDKGSAITTLLNSQDEEGKWGGDYGGPDEVGIVITALAKYKDNPKVEEAINKGLNYLKKEQDEATGGFMVWGSENPYSASAVIQGLVAIGEDPLSEEWTKGGRTIVDSLMNFYEDGYFKDESEWSTEIDSVTEQAFIALADVYRKKSMFNEIRLNTNQISKITIEKPNIDKITEGEIVILSVTGYDTGNNIVPIKDIVWTSSDSEIATVGESGRVITKKPGTITITAEIKGVGISDSIELKIHKKEFEIEYIGDFNVKNGEQVDAKVKLKNLTEETKPATLIITLYDNQTDRLLNYSIVKKELENKEELELAVGFLVPETGYYYIKAFLWENLQDQNIIMEEVQEIKIAG